MNMQPSFTFPELLLGKPPKAPLTHQRKTTKVQTSLERDDIEKVHVKDIFIPKSTGVSDPTEDYHPITNTIKPELLNYKTASSESFTVLYRSVLNIEEATQNKDLKEYALAKFGFIQGDDNMVQQWFLIPSSASANKDMTSKCLETREGITVDISDISRINFTPMKMNNIYPEAYRIWIENKNSETLILTFIIPKMTDFFKFMDIVERLNLPLKFHGGEKIIQTSREINPLTDPTFEQNNKSLAFHRRNISSYQEGNAIETQKTHKRTSSINSINNPLLAKLDLSSRNSHTISEDLFLDMPIERPNVEERSRSEDELLKKVLRDGMIFWKYGNGRWAQISLRKVYFSDDLSFLCWGKPNSFSVLKIFPTKSIQKIVYGRETKNFKRFATKNSEHIRNSFSIILEDRSVDLMANHTGEMRAFCDALNYLLNSRKKNIKSC